MPLPTPYHITASRSNHSFNLLIDPYRLVLPVLGQHVNGIIQNILFCLATPSPTLIVKFLHLLTFSDNLLFFIVKEYYSCILFLIWCIFILWLYCVFFFFLLMGIFLFWLLWIKLLWALLCIFLVDCFHLGIYQAVELSVHEVYT